MWASILVALATGSVRGQPESLELGPVRVRATLGLVSETVRAGWNPVEVVVENTGVARTVEVRVAVGEPERPYVTLRRRLDLPAGGRRREWFLAPVRPDTFDQLVVSAHLDDGKRVSVHTLDVSAEEGLAPRGRREPWVLYVAAKGRVDWRRAQWVIVDGSDRFGLRTPDRLPDRALAFDSVDLVVLHDVDPGELGEPQRAALEAWVRAGGRLLLVPGKREGWFREPWIAGLLGGASVDGQEVAGLTALEQRHGSLLGRRVATPAEREAFTFFSVDAGPDQPFLEHLPSGRRGSLMPRLPCGRGSVFVLAVDPTAPPFDRWLGRDSMVLSLRRSLLRDRQPVLLAAYGAGDRGVDEDPLVRPGLTTSLDSREDPSKVLVVLLVVVYVLVVGPLNWWFVQRRRRPLLLVLTIPGLSLLFCAAVILSGYVTKGLRTVVWRTSVLSADLGEPLALEQTAVSVRSSRSTTYRIELPPHLVGARVFRGGRAAVVAGQELRDDDGAYALPEVPLRIWEQAVVEGFGLRDLGGSLVLEEPQPGGRRLRNSTSFALLRVVALGGGVHVADAVPAGAEVELRKQEAVKLRRVTWSDRLAELLLPEGAPADHEHLGKVLRRTAPFLGDRWRSGGVVVALLEGPPSRLLVDGEEQADRAISLLVARRPQADRR